MTTTPPRTGDPELDHALAELAARTTRLEEVSRLLSETTGRGESAGGQVAVELSATGSLAGLHLDPRALRLGSHGLEEAITEAFRRAEEDVARRSHDLARTAFDP
ncbi:YbaB/EbfC family nucleoid-associated protein [Nonomuraea sp. FMUSA5-5]|uniref:YbaB/EbfC family nucleoid-associated protein n=1 Tax=Nonomuraea composti TaxID=2720023 RepID=A0ABX1ARQ2_9ACTN|nr:YbaB/EbfC family nucleoid-associated protein [Nonomuraea sp. FMUSA5-5]NJP88329.1 YbaB/EbfC family nucleoid-associated protein [Nonomuraea sp. FMUSA5-5]